jgi:hypothetical protein
VKASWSPVVPSAPPAPAGPFGDHRRGEADGARAARGVPVGPLAGLIACQFDVVRWLAPWRDRWGQTFARPEWSATVPTWLPELAGYLGGYAAPLGSTYSTFAPPAPYLTGFCIGMRNAWAAAVDDGLLPPDQPTLTHWLAAPPVGLPLKMPFPEATIDDLDAARSRARRATGTRMALRVLLWLAAAFFLLGETAMIATSVSGDWSTDGTPTAHPVANAVGANLVCGLPLVGLGVLVYLDLRRARRRLR